MSAVQEPRVYQFPDGGTVLSTQPIIEAHLALAEAASQAIVDEARRAFDEAVEATDGLVFTGVKGGPIPPNALTAAWKTLLASAGVNTNVVLHGARHTTVDLLYMAGVPEDLIQEIVGHSTRGMSRAYKTKGNTARLTEAMQRMSALLTPSPQHEIEGAA